MKGERLTFLQLATKIFEEEKIPLSGEEIWEFAKKKGYDSLVRSKGKTPWVTIQRDIYIDMRDNPRSKFIKAWERPRRFFLGTIELSIHPITEKEIKEAVELTVKKLNYKEKDLHPVLSYFASRSLKAFTKTIRHNISTKNEYKEWLHPDIVGCYFPIGELKAEVIDFGKSIGNLPLKIFSFELKRELKFSNLRESFFQTVSNSSWANESYLVAAEISDDEDFLDELRRLSSSFGIGVINLDITDPDSSKILFPTRVKESLDWETMNKLTINPDFNNFLISVRDDISSKRIHKEDYDKVLEKEELIKKFI